MAEKEAYPIVKIPIGIQKKIDKEKVNVTSKRETKEDIDTRDPFAYLFPPPTPKKKAKYPPYILILYGLIPIWLIILTGVILKIIPGIAFLGFIAASIFILIFAFKQMLVDRKIEKNIHRSLAVANKPVIIDSSTSPPIFTEISSQIDWTDEIKNITRSSKTSSAQVGVSEKFFLGHLQRLLPNKKINFGHVYLPDGYKHPYSADIEIVLDNGLCLQLEVDEPYDGKSRKPHHCWDNDKDTKRDRYFLSIGWVVVRFSEKQIVTNPKGCCGVIANLIVKLTEDESLKDLAKLGESLERDSQWGEPEARLMEKLKLREKYLAAAGLWNVKGRK
jgi:hypothetical protein